MYQKTFACVVSLFIFSSTICGSAIAESSETFIEEVIVTAQRRTQNLQDIPASVTAFTDDAINKLGFSQSVDIAAQTPNFSVGYPTGESGVPALFIRGVGLSDFRAFTPSAIAPYADEVYIAQSAGQIFQLLDMERVEVLRGPQGTLYGRNATGGAINYISKKPTQEWEGWVRASIAEYGYNKLTGAVGGGLSDELRVRFSALKTDSDGWMENQLTGNDQQGVDELAWRALIEWDVTDSIDVLLNVHGGDTKSDSIQYRHRGLFDINGAPCELAALKAQQCIDAFGYSENLPYTDINGRTITSPDYDEGAYDLEATNDTSFWGASAKINVDFGGNLVFTSITAFDDLDDLRPEDSDVSPNDVLAVELGVDQQTFSQELRLAQQLDRWNWIAGAYYLSDEATDQGSGDVLGFLRPFFVGVDHPAVCADASGIVPAPGNPTGFCPGQAVMTIASRTEQEITSYSLYFDASINLSEQLTANVGLRYTDEEVEHDVREIYIDAPSGNPVRRLGNASESFDNLSGRLVLDWQLSDDVMLYGGISTGFKAGGIDSTVDGIVPYDSEDIISFETGFKTILAGSRVRLNGAAFYYDYTDMQVYTFIQRGEGAFAVLTNASDADIWGGELELQWLPTETTFISLGAGYLDAEYEDFVDVLGGSDFSGNRIVMSPEVTFNGVILQDFSFGNYGTLTAQLDFSYQDEVFFDPANNPLLSEDSYWLYNARLEWTSLDDQWEVALWARNLGDEEYMIYAFSIAFFGLNQEMLGTPRTIGAEATYRF